MARNRDRARERQARRKAERAARRAAGEDGDAEVGDPFRDEITAGAPPSGTGRSDTESDDEQGLDSEHDGESFDPALDDPEEEVAPTVGRRGRREAGDGEVADHSNRPRFVQFLLAVRAELARVQWPDRPTLTTLTGVVLGFVLIAGGYLGALDAIFSRLVQAIL